MSAAVGYLVFVAVNGTEPLFPIVGNPGFDFRDLAGAAALGVAAGLAARVFAALIRRAKQLSSLRHPVLRITAAGLSLALLFTVGRLLTGESLVLGPGYSVITWALDPTHAVWLVLAVLGLRCLATVSTVAGGGAGGLFIPLVVAGALMGRAVGGAVHALDTSLFVVVGVSAFLGAGYRVPLADRRFPASVLTSSANGRAAAPTIPGDPTVMHLGLDQFVLAQAIVDPVVVGDQQPPRLTAPVEPVRTDRPRRRSRRTHRSAAPRPHHEPDRARWRRRHDGGPSCGLPRQRSVARMPSPRSPQAQHLTNLEHTYSRSAVAPSWSAGRMAASGAAAASLLVDPGVVPSVAKRPSHAPGEAQARRDCWRSGGPPRPPSARGVASGSPDRSDGAAAASIPRHSGLLGVTTGHSMRLTPGALRRRAPSSSATPSRKPTSSSTGGATSRQQEESRSPDTDPARSQLRSPE